VGEPNPPDTVSALHEVAVAGGTDEAFLIGTDVAAESQDRLRRALEAIQSDLASCEVMLPGELTLDPDQVRLNYVSAAGPESVLEYDPGCARDAGWRFDENTEPPSIVLCDAICETVLDELGDGQLWFDPGCQ